MCMINVATTKALTLEDEIAKYIDSLPCWAKYISNLIVSGKSVSEIEINTAYSYLLSENFKDKKTELPEICLNACDFSDRGYSNETKILKLEKVIGVNALAEGQIIEFSPNLTILYGENGSGKSGYARLLKKAFVSRTPEDILANIHEETHKLVSSEFTFTNGDETTPSKFPDDATNKFYRQFTVFDGKSAIKLIDQKNEFEFRPSGLVFFTRLNDALKLIEEKLNYEIRQKQKAVIIEDVLELFEGDSEVKEFIKSITEKTTIAELSKFSFSDCDITLKKEIDEKYDELYLASRQKSTQIQTLEKNKSRLLEIKITISNINTFFSSAKLLQIKNLIDDCQSKIELSKKEGLSKFDAEKIIGLGSLEWKGFISSAYKYVRKIYPDSNYPNHDEVCVFCHQPLSMESRELVLSYWKYLTSIAEENASQAKVILASMRNEYEKLSLDILSENDVLTLFFKPVIGR